MKRPPSTNDTGSESRNVLRAMWRAHRAHGVGAVIAAFADAAHQDRFAWRRPGHATDPMVHARACFATACRNGTLRGA